MFHRVLMVSRAFAHQPFGRVINRGTLGQQFALCGADRACFHQTRRFKGGANLGKLIGIQLDILVRYPYTPALFQDRAALGHKRGIGDSIFSQVQRGTTLLVDAK